MKTSIVTAMVVPLAGLLASAAQADDNFRCGKWIASSGMSVTELRAKCGEPASRETRTEDVLVRNRNTGLMYKSGVTQIEVWTYDRGTTASPMVVTIVDGQIKSIARKK